MTRRVVTAVSAAVDSEREDELVAGFRVMAGEPRPEGLLRSELLRGPDGRGVVQTLGRDRAALDARRARPEPPAAPTLFRSVGAEPTLEILEVAADLSG